jgi:hypothetical protein
MDATNKPSFLQWAKMRCWKCDKMCTTISTLQAHSNVSMGGGLIPPNKLQGQKLLLLHCWLVDMLCKGRYPRATEETCHSPAVFNRFYTDCSEFKGTSAPCSFSTRTFSAESELRGILVSCRVSTTCFSEAGPHSSVGCDSFLIVCREQKF